MKLKEIRELSNTELESRIYGLKEQLFNMRRQASTGQLEKGKNLHFIRKDIARMYTVLRERQLGIK